MKEKDLDKDTIVAYHAYLQTRIHNDLNHVGLGPGWLPCRLAQTFAIFSVASTVTGILVITLRHRHVYLVDWGHQFLGPFFIILGLLLASLATYLTITAKRRSNAYRRELFFRSIGDYGVAVVHKSTLIHEQDHKSELKSGTTPHRTIRPREEAFSKSSHSRHHRGHENRGYNDNGYDDRHHRSRDRDDRERRHRDDRDRRPRDDHERRRRPDDRPRDDRRPHHDDRERRRPPPDDRHRRPPRDDRDRDRDYPEKRRPPPDDRDIERGEPEKRRPPPDDQPVASSSGGRRKARGIPKIAVTESSKDSHLTLDPDFGRPMGMPGPTDESEL